MWGPYQRTPWTVREIHRLLVWRCRLFKEPRRIFNDEIADFEKSRWMMFVFWEEKLEDLVAMEVKLMETLIILDDRVGGCLRRNLDKDIKSIVLEQYKSTFSMNEKEIEMNNRQTCFGKQISCILESIP